MYTLYKLQLHSTQNTSDFLLFYFRDHEPSEEYEGKPATEDAFKNLDDDGLVIKEAEDEMVADDVDHKEEDKDQAASLTQSRRGSVNNKSKILTFHEKRLMGMMGPDAVQYLR